VDIIDFSAERAINNLILMACAYLLALPIAWNREGQSRSAGLRTFPLVAIASCGFMLIAAHTFDDQQAFSRALQGMIGGIGFIGAGAILKNKDSVQGTATAAGLWGTGAIGAAIAWGHFEIAAMISLISFFTFKLLTDVKEKVNRPSKRKV
jgi:putative Mg2+ transporter-C (MgtC) family protein